jgi:hypothetical protein
VFYCTATGAFLVPPDKKVEGSNVIIATALVGYALTEYPDGMEGEPAHLPWVDSYISHFVTVVEPSCSLACSPTPSTPNQPIHSTPRSRKQSKAIKFIFINHLSTRSSVTKPKGQTPDALSGTCHHHWQHLRPQAAV